ncbi:GNAT family N-acetyltransferase [Tenacibaculum caenipelagi]|nr:GNAT family N-acetyltransferase [Tenacibaculum caenipelagi]
MIDSLTNFNFDTQRLTISKFSNPKNDLEKDFFINVTKILTPNVTKSLPKGWQNINTLSTAKKWVKERNKESVFLIVKTKDTSEMIGFIFLFPIYLENNLIDIRFGYLLSESFWKKGLGTELIKGLVYKCQNSGNIKSISGGIERDNIGSIRVMQKCGFQPLNTYEKDNTVFFYQYSFDCKPTK